MATSPKPVTRICTSDADHITIRGRDLCTELIGHVTFTEMVLLHLLGTTPTRAQTVIVDSVLVTIMEHGMTPSAIATRLTFLGAPESLQGAVASGLLGVGTRYAGAAGDCAALIDQIVAVPTGDRAAKAAQMAAHHRQTRTPIPGYGHPVHKEGDPRTLRLFEIARGVGVAGAHIDAALLFEDKIAEAYGRRLILNASGAIGTVLAEAGLPSTIMRGMALIARCAGLVGHLLEEMEVPAATHIWHLAEQGVPYTQE